MIQFTIGNCTAEVSSVKDLQALVPTGFEGEALNYGQGEGQMRIANTVWGIYIDDSNGYKFVMEEGIANLSEAIFISSSLLRRIREIWGIQVTDEVKGHLYSSLDHGC